MVVARLLCFMQITPANIWNMTVSCPFYVSWGFFCEYWQKCLVDLFHPVDAESSSYELVLALKTNGGPLPEPARRRWSIISNRKNSISSQQGSRSPTISAESSITEAIPKDLIGIELLIINFTYAEGQTPILCRLMVTSSWPLKRLSEFREESFPGEGRVQWQRPKPDDTPFGFRISLLKSLASAIVSTLTNLNAAPIGGANPW